MDILTILRLAIGTFFIFAGLLTIVLAIIGIFRLNYVLNRMHVAATCDTLGMLLVLVGLVFFEGISFTTLSGAPWARQWKVATQPSAPTGQEVVDTVVALVFNS